IPLLNALVSARLFAAFPSLCLCLSVCLSLTQTQTRRAREMEAAKPLIRVAALCGSLRKGSYNQGLLRSAIELSKEINGLHVESVDIAPLPMLNTDLEVDGTYPSAVEAFRQKIKSADSILFASPEYNFSVTAPLKNAIDWASRPPNIWADKAAAIVSAGGGFGGGTVAISPSPDWSFC
ncbi:hypothetical protein F2P56_010399, partial [Juglans regia]